MTIVSMHDADVDHQVEDVVLGVDTHKDIYVAAALTLTGGVIAHASFPTTTAGYQQLIAWAQSFGKARRAGVEGTGSYGFALARQLQAEGLTVLEVNRPDRAVRRRRGKTDTIDAENAARAVLGGEATAVPKAADGPVEMLRVFKIAKDSAIKARTQSINQLKRCWSVPSQPCETNSPDYPTRGSSPHALPWTPHQPWPPHTPPSTPSSSWPSESST